MEVVLGMGIDGDLPVLRLDLLTQPIGINEDIGIFGINAHGILSLLSSSSLWHFRQCRLT
jgi:hypothetical protein